MEYRDDNPDYSVVFRKSGARKNLTEKARKPDKPHKPEKPFPTSGFFVEETVAAMRANAEMGVGKRKGRTRNWRSRWE